MFDTLLQQYGGAQTGQRRQIASVPDGWTLDIGQTNQSSGDTYIQNDPRETYQYLDPAVIRSLGFTGSAGVMQGDGDMTANVVNPEFLQFIDQRGLRQVSRRLDEYTSEHQFVDQNGNPVGQTWQSHIDPAGDLRAMGTVLASAGAAYGLSQAGAGAGAAAGGSGNATNAALIESSLGASGTPGYVGASSAGAGNAGAGAIGVGGVGTTAGGGTPITYEGANAGAIAASQTTPAAAPATNAALAESAVQTGGYGASSAGAGNAATGWEAFNLGGANIGAGSSSAASSGGGTNWLDAIGSALSGNGSSSSGWANLLQSLGGYYMANRASNSQQDAVNQANEWLRPYREAGGWAVGQQRNLLENPGSISSDPSYQFGLNQGVKAYDQSATARGMRLSGAQARALTRYGQDYAGTQLDRALNRYGAVAGTGQVATNQTANNALMGGNASAAGTVGGWNALMGGLNNYLRQQDEQRILDQYGTRSYIGGG